MPDIFSYDPTNPYSADMYSPFVGGDPVLNGYRPLDTTSTMGLERDNSYGRSYLGEPVRALRVFDKVMTREQISRVRGGDTLLRYSDKLASGEERGFTDAVTERFSTIGGNLSTFVPFVGSLAKVGGDFLVAKRAADTMERLTLNDMQGDVSDEDRVALQAYFAQSQWEATSNTWALTADIALDAPALAMEMGISGAVSKAAVKGLASQSSKIASLTAMNGAEKATARSVSTVAKDALLTIAGDTKVKRFMVNGAVDKTKALSTLRDIISHNPTRAKELEKALADNAGEATTKFVKGLFRDGIPAKGFSSDGAKFLQQLAEDAAISKRVAANAAKSIDDPKLMQSISQAITRKNPEEVAALLKDFVKGTAEQKQLLQGYVDTIQTLAKQGDAPAAMNAVKRLISESSIAGGVDDATKAAISNYTRRYVETMVNLNGNGLVKQQWLHTLGWVKDHAIRGVFEHYDALPMVGYEAAGELANALGVAIIEAPIKGLLYTTLSTAARVPISLALTGGTSLIPVHRTELAAKARAFEAGDKDLMESSFWVGLGQLAVEMASENVGQAFSAVGRKFLNTRRLPFSRGVSLADRYRAFLSAERITERYLQVDRDGALTFRRWISAFCGDTSHNALSMELLRKRAISNLIVKHPEQAVKALGGEFSVQQVLADPQLYSKALEASKKYMSQKTLKMLFTADMMQRAASRSSGFNLYSPTGVRKLLEHVGFDGTLEEWMEERYGGLVSSLLHLDGKTQADREKQGWLSRLWDDTMPHGAQGWAELFAFLIPGTLQRNLMMAQASLGTGALSHFNEIMERGEALTNRSMAVIDGFTSEEERKLIVRLARQATHEVSEEESSAGDTSLDAAAENVASLRRDEKILVGDHAVGAKVSYANEAFEGTNTQPPESQEYIRQFVKDLIAAAKEYHDFVTSTDWNTQPPLMTKILHKALGAMTFLATGQFSALRWNPVFAMSQTWSDGREFLVTASRIIRQAEHDAKEQVDAMYNRRVATEAGVEAADPTEQRGAKSRQKQAEEQTRGVLTEEARAELLEKTFQSIVDPALTELITRKFAAEGAIRMSMDGSIQEAAERLADARIRDAVNQKADKIVYIDPLGEKIEKPLPASEEDRKALREEMIAADRIKLAVRFLSLATNGTLRYSVGRDQRNQRVATLCMAADAAANEPDSEVAVYQSQLDAALATTPEFRNVTTFISSESLDDPLGQRLIDFGAALDMSRVENVAKINPAELDAMTEEELADDSRIADLSVLARSLNVLHGGNGVAVRNAFKQIIRLCKMLNHRFQLSQTLAHNEESLQEKWYKELPGKVTYQAHLSNVMEDQNGGKFRVLSFVDETGASRNMKLMAKQIPNSEAIEWVDPQHQDENAASILHAAGYNPVRPRFIFAPCSTVVSYDPLIAANIAAGTRNLFKSEARKRGFTFLTVDVQPGTHASIPFEIYRSNAHLSAARAFVENYEAHNDLEEYTLLVPDFVDQGTADRSEIRTSDQDVTDTSTPHMFTREEAAQFAKEFHELEAIAKAVLYRNVAISDAYSTDGRAAYVIHVASLSDARNVVVPFDPVRDGSTTSAVVHSMVFNRLLTYVGPDGFSITGDHNRYIYGLDDLVGSLCETAETLADNLEQAWRGEDSNASSHTIENAEKIVMLRRLAERMKGGATEELLADIITNITLGYGQYAKRHGNAIGGQAAWGALAEEWLSAATSRPQAAAGKFTLDMITSVLFSDSIHEVLSTPEGHAASLTSFFAPGGAFEVYSAPGTSAWFQKLTPSRSRTIDPNASVTNTTVEAPAQNTPPVQENQQQNNQPQDQVVELTPEQLQSIVQGILVIGQQDPNKPMGLYDFYHSLRSSTKGGVTADDDSDDNGDDNGNPNANDESDDYHIKLATTERTSLNELPLDAIISIAISLQSITATKDGNIFSNVNTPQDLLQQVREKVPHLGAAMDDAGKDARMLLGFVKLFQPGGELQKMLDEADAVRKKLKDLPEGDERNVAEADLKTKEDTIDALVKASLGEQFDTQQVVRAFRERQQKDTDTNEELNEDEADEANNAKDGDGGFDRTALQELELAPEWQMLKFLLGSLFPTTRNNVAAAVRYLLDIHPTHAVGEPGQITAMTALRDLLLSGANVVHNPLFAVGSPAENTVLSNLVAAPQLPMVAKLMFAALQQLPRHRYNRLMIAMANIVEVSGVETNFKGQLLDDRSGRLTQTSDNLYYLAGLELFNQLKRMDAPPQLVVTQDPKKGNVTTAPWQFLGSSGLFTKEACPTWAHLFETLNRLVKPGDGVSSVPYFEIPGYSGRWDTLNNLLSTQAHNNGSTQINEALAALHQLARRDGTTLAEFVDVLRTSGASYFKSSTVSGGTPSLQGVLTQLLNAYTMSTRAGRRTSHGTTTELNRASLSISQEKFLQNREVRDLIKEAGSEDLEMSARFAEWTRGEPMFTHVTSPYTSPYDILISGILATEQILSKAEGETPTVLVDDSWIHIQLYTGDRSTLATMRIPRAIFQKVLEKTAKDAGENATASDRYAAAAAWFYTRMGYDQLSLKGGTKRTQIVAAEQIPLDLGYQDGGVTYAPRVLCILSESGENETMYGTGMMVSPDGSAKDPLLATEMPGATSSKVHLVGYNPTTGQYEMIKGNFLAPDTHSVDQPFYASSALNVLHQAATEHAKVKRTRVILTDFDGTKVGPLVGVGYEVSIKPEETSEGAQPKEPTKAEQIIAESLITGSENYKLAKKFGANLSRAIYAMARAGVSLNEVNETLARVRVKISTGTFSLSDLMTGFEVVQLPEGSPQKFAVSYGGGKMSKGKYNGISYRALKAANLFHESDPSAHPIAKNTLNDVMTAYQMLDPKSPALMLMNTYPELASLLLSDPVNRQAFLESDPDLARDIELGGTDFSVELESQRHMNATMIKAMRPTGERIKAILVTPHAKRGLQDGQVTSDDNWSGDDPFYNATGTDEHVGFLRANIRDKRIRYGCFFTGTVQDAVTALGTKKNLTRLPSVTREALRWLASHDNITAASLTSTKEQEQQLAQQKDKILRLFTDIYGNQMTLETHGDMLWADAFTDSPSDRTLTDLNDTNRPKVLPTGGAVPTNASGYIAGTLLTFPRTPSGNAGPVFTSLRLSTPVTLSRNDAKTEDGGTTTSYEPGVDSFAIPPPDAEWRQGSDNDGDTAMITLPFYGRNLLCGQAAIRRLVNGFTPKGKKAAVPGLAEKVASARSFLLELKNRGITITPEWVKNPDAIVDLNNKTTLDTGKLIEGYRALHAVLTVTKKGTITISPYIRSQIGALYAAMFNTVSLARTTKGEFGNSLYDKEWGVGVADTDGIHLAPAEETDDRPLTDVYRIAMVTSSGRDASTARGSIVAGIASIHTCARFQFYPLTDHKPTNPIWTRDWFPKLIKELDPYANALFDDLKEQVSIRLRLNPNTNDAFLGMVLSYFQNNPEAGIPTKDKVDKLVDQFITLFDGKADASGKRTPFAGVFGQAMAYSFGFFKSNDHRDHIVPKYFPSLAESYKKDEDRARLETLVSLAKNKQLATQLVSAVDALISDDGTLPPSSTLVKLTNPTTNKDISVTFGVAYAVRQAISGGLREVSLQDVAKSDLVRAMIATALLPKGDKADAQALDGLTTIVSSLATMSVVHRFAAAHSVYKATNASARVVTSANTPFTVDDQGFVFFAEEEAGSGSNPVEVTHRPMGYIDGNSKELEAARLSARRAVANVAGTGLSEETLVHNVESTMASQYMLSVYLSNLARVMSTTADDEDVCRAILNCETEEDLLALLTDEHYGKSPLVQKVITQENITSAKEVISEHTQSVDRQGVLDAIRMVPAAVSACKWAANNISAEALSLIFAVGQTSAKVETDGRTTLAFLHGVEGLFMSSCAGADTSIQHLRSKKGALTAAESKALNDLLLYRHVLAQFAPPQVNDKSSRRLRITPATTGITPGRMDDIHQIIADILQMGDNFKPVLYMGVSRANEDISNALSSVVHMEGFKRGLVGVADEIAKSTKMITPANLLAALAVYSTLTSRSRPTSDAGAGSLLDFFPEKLRQKIFHGAGEVGAQARGILSSLGDPVIHDIRGSAIQGTDSYEEAFPVVSSLLFGLPVRTLGSEYGGDPRGVGTPFVEVDGLLRALSGRSATPKPVKKPTAPTADYQNTFKDSGVTLTIHYNQAYESDDKNVDAVIHKGALSLGNPTDPTFAGYVGDARLLHLTNITVVSASCTPPVGTMDTTQSSNEYRFAIPFQTADLANDMVDKLNQQLSEGNNPVASTARVELSTQAPKEGEAGPTWIIFNVRPLENGVSNNVEGALQRTYTTAVKAVVDEYRARKAKMEAESKAVSEQTTVQLVATAGTSRGANKAWLDSGLDVHNYPQQTAAPGEQLQYVLNYSQGVHIDATVPKATAGITGWMTAQDDNAFDPNDQAFLERIIKTVPGDKGWELSTAYLRLSIPEVTSTSKVGHTVTLYDLLRRALTDINVADPLGQTENPFVFKLKAGNKNGGVIAFREPSEDNPYGPSIYILYNTGDQNLTPEDSVADKDGMAMRALNSMLQKLTKTQAPTPGNPAPTTNDQPEFSNLKPVMPGSPVATKAVEFTTRIHEALDSAISTSEGYLWGQVLRVFRGEDRKGPGKFLRTPGVIEYVDAENPEDAYRQLHDLSVKDATLISPDAQDDLTRVRAQVRAEIVDLLKSVTGFDVEHDQAISDKIDTLVDMAWKTHVARLNSWAVPSDGSPSQWPSAHKVAQIARVALGQGHALMAAQIRQRINTALDAIKVVQDKVAANNGGSLDFQLNEKGQSAATAGVPINEALYAYSVALRSVLDELCGPESDPFGKDTIKAFPRIMALLSLLNFEDLGRGLPGILTPGYEDFRNAGEEEEAIDKDFYRQSAMDSDERLDYVYKVSGRSLVPVGDHGVGTSVSARAKYVMGLREDEKYNPELRRSIGVKDQFYPWASKFGAAQASNLRGLLRGAFGDNSPARLYATTQQSKAFIRQIRDTLLLRTTPYIDTNVSEAQVASMIRLLDALSGEAGRELRDATRAVRDAAFDILAYRATVRVTHGDFFKANFHSFLQGALDAGLPEDSAIGKLEAEQNALFADPVTGNLLKSFLSVTSPQGVFNNTVDVDEITPFLIELDPAIAFKHFTLPSADRKFDLRDTMLYSSGQEAVVEARAVGRFYDQLLGVSDAVRRIPQMVVETTDRIVYDEGTFHRGKDKDFRRIRFIDYSRNLIHKGLLNSDQAFTEEEYELVQMFARAMSAYVTGGSDLLYTGIGNASASGYPFGLDLSDIAVMEPDGKILDRFLTWEEFRAMNSLDEIVHRQATKVAGSHSTTAFNTWLVGFYRQMPAVFQQGENSLAEKILRIIYDAATQAVREHNKSAGDKAPSRLSSSSRATQAAQEALHKAGFLRESLVKDRRGRKITTVTIPSQEIFDMFYGSSAYQKLLRNGRTEEMLSKEYAKKLMAPALQSLALFRESNPEIFQGELSTLSGMGSNFWLADNMGMLSRAKALQMSLLQEHRTSKLSSRETTEQAVSLARTLASRAYTPLIMQRRKDNGEYEFSIDTSKLSGGNLVRLYNELILPKVRFSPGSQYAGEGGWQRAKLTATGDVKKVYSAQDLMDMGLIPTNGMTSEQFAALSASQKLDMVHKASFVHLAGIIYEAVVKRDLEREYGQKTNSDIEAEDFRRAYEVSKLPYMGVNPTRIGATVDEAFLYEASLPADGGLGTMMKMMASSVAKACAFTGTLHNMVFTKNSNNRPNYLLIPSVEADKSFGEIFSDRFWGELAQWYLANYPEAVGLTYNGAESGRANCARIAKTIRQKLKHGSYSEVVDRRDGDQSGSIRGVERIFCLVPNATMKSGVGSADAGVVGEGMDDQHWAPTGIIGGVSGEAEGYLRTLLALRAVSMGSATMKVIDNILSWVKARNVMFSLFFDIATGLESPIAGAGGLQTLLGRFGEWGSVGRGINDWMHEQAEQNQDFATALNDSGSFLTRLLGGGTPQDQGYKGGYTALTIGDLALAWESNDPGLIQLKRLATSCGITLDSPGENTYFDHNAKEWGKNVDKAAKKFAALVGKAGYVKEGEAEKFIGGFLRGLAVDKQERAFVHLMNITKLAVASQLLSRLRTWAIMEGRYFDPVKELRKVGNYINEEVGGINPLAHAFATPKAKAIMDRSFFSWMWTMSSWSAGAGTVLSNALLGGEATNPTLRGMFYGRWLRMYLWVMHGFPFVTQLLCTGIGKALVDGFGDDDDKKRYRPDQYRWFYWNNEERGKDSWDFTPILDGLAVLDKHLTGGWIASSKRGENGLLASGATYLIPMTSELSNPYARRHYGHAAKQASEVLRWFDPDEAVTQLFSKLNIPLQNLWRQITGRNPVSGFEAEWKKKNYKGSDRLLSSLWGVMSSGLPFSFAGISSFPEAGALTWVAPVKRGQGSWLAQNQLKPALMDYARRAHLVRGKPQFSRLRTNIAKILTDCARNGLDPKDVLKTAKAEATKEFYEEAYANRPLGNSKPNQKFLRAVAALRALGVSYKNAEQSFSRRDKRASSGRTNRTMSAAQRSAYRAVREGLGGSTTLFSDDPKYLYQQDAKGGDVFGQRKKVLSVEMSIPSTVLGVKVGKGPEDPDDDPKGPGPKGGKRISLASDETPSTIFGIPVTVQPHPYFDQDPRVPGFYEMGDEAPLAQADEKGGEAEDYRYEGMTHKEVDEYAAQNNMNAEIDFTNEFNTPVPEELQAQYEEWRKVNAGNDPGYDYDYGGAFLAGMGRGDADNGHLPDDFKKPNHPTFDPRSSKHAISPEEASGRFGLNTRQWVDRQRHKYADENGN